MSDRIRPRFGIVSGAGPMAGVILMKHIIEIFQLHGAWKDSHFPEIRLINFPFSEMLEDEFDSERVRKELNYCIKELESTCDYIIIACQTIHLFLSQEFSSKIINLFDLMNGMLINGMHKPFIVTSETSSKYNLHGTMLGIECEYFDPKKSQVIINRILKGNHVNLEWLLNMAQNRTILIGCTDYSVALDQYPIHENIIDPLRLAALKIHQLAVQ